MASIVVDDSRFPLVRVTFDGAVADHVFDAYLHALSRVLSRRAKNVIVFDALRAPPPTAKERAKQAAWLKQHRDVIERFSCGSAFVIKSAIVRGGLTAILWIAPIPGAHTVVATVAEAEAWALARLRDAGVTFGAPP
ncbi:MAG TPA: hypothetical protein VHV30_12275 [Polyangiaceae bacterium]|jgi:hypothetical protein|nr:hypothetical protein [Polyangiaceae bacterium]